MDFVKAINLKDDIDWISRKLTGKTLRQNQDDFFENTLNKAIGWTSKRKPDNLIEGPVKKRKRVENVSQDTPNMATGGKRASKPRTGSAKKRKVTKPRKVKDVARDGTVTGGKRTVSRKPAVKVSATMKAQVLKVLERKAPKGFFELMSYDLIDRRVDTRPQEVLTGLTNNSGTVFSHYLANYFASRLFNEKDRLLRLQLDSNSRFMLTGEASDKRSFPANEFKLDVLKNDLVTRFKNNTNRSKTVHVFFCNPKHLDASVVDYSTPSAPVLTTALTPIGSWDAALALRTTAEEYKLSVPNGSNTVEAVTKYKLYQDPRQHPEFNKLWACDVRTVKMEPGESAAIGKKLFTGNMDFRKYFRNGVFQDVAPCNTYMFYVIIDDLVIGEVAAGTEVIAYRCADATAEQVQQGISVEYQHNFVCSIPEQAGFKYGGVPAAGNQQTLTERQDKYCFDHYSNTSVASARVAKYRVDPLDPNMDVSQ